MNSLPRWLISITDMPDPCQSSISAAACASTSSGRTAGPALKLKTRVSGLLPILFFLFLLRDALDARELGALVEVDQAHPLGRAALLADLLYARAYQHAARRDEHDLVLDDPLLGRIGELRERRLLHRAERRREEHEMLVVVLLHRQHGVDLLALGERKEIHDRLAAARARPLRHVVNLEPVHAPARREAQHGVVRVRYEQALDEIVLLGRRRLLAAPAAALRAVVGQGLRLDVARVREGHDDVLGGD